MSGPEITPAMWVVIGDALDALTDNLSNYGVRPWDYREQDSEMPGALTHETGYRALIGFARRAAAQNADGLVGPLSPGDD